MKQKKLIFNFFVNRNCKKLTDSRKRAKIFADNRKRHHSIETLGLFITEQYAVWFSLEFCAWNNVQSQILLNIMIKHILNYILCPQLVVKT